MVVGHCDGKAVGQAFAGSQTLQCGQGRILRIAIIAVGVHAECAVVARYIAQRQEADHIMHIHIRGHRQRAAGSGAAFGDVHDCGGQHRRVVAAVDAHGQGAGGRAAVAVGCRERKDVGEAFANTQALHRRQCIIQGIGVIARGIQRKRAVKSRRACLRYKVRNIMKIRIDRRGQGAADPDRILNNGGCGSSHARRIVTAVDGHGQSVRPRASAPIGYRERKGVGEAFARAQALHRGQRIIQGIGVIARGIHGKCAVQTDRAGLRNESHNVMHVRVHRRGQHSADADRIFADGSRGSGHDGRSIAAAVDAHGYDRGRRTAVVIGHCNGKAVGQAVRGAQSLHRGQGGIQHIGIVAVRVHTERAVTARRIAQGREADRIMHIHIRGHGQGAVGDGSVLVNAHYRGGQHRGVITAVDGHGQSVGGRAAVAVGCRERKGVGEAFARAQALHRGQRIIQGIGVIARSIQRERAVEPGRACLRYKTRGIVQIRVHGRGQRAAEADRIFNNGGCGSSHNGRVVAAVDAHGYDRGRRAAVIVGHCDGKAVGQAFAGSQALQCGQGRVLHIGIVAVGVHAERAVAARHIGLGREADHIMHIRVRGQGQGAAGGSAAFGDVHDCGGQHRRVIGAVDNHGQGVGGRAAVPVGHRKGESVGEAFAQTQALHRRQAIVQNVGIVPGSVQAERTIQARRIGSRGERQNISGIRVRG